MALTDKQKQNIMHLDADTLIEIMHECAEQFVRVSEFHEATGVPVRTIYDRINRGELKSTEIFGVRVLLP